MLSVGEMPRSFARLIYASQECPGVRRRSRRVLSAPAARIRLMTSRCRGPPRSLCRWTSREKRRRQVSLKLSKYLDKTHFIITPNSSLDSASTAVQESAILVTVCNQLSRIFDIEHGGTLSPHAQTFKVFRMHNWTVKSCFCT